jgi:hypothetical protein
MTDIMTSQNIDLSSWDTLYTFVFANNSSFFLNLLMKHAPSLVSNTTCCEIVGNAVPASIRVPSLHFLYIYS